MADRLHVDIRPDGDGGDVRLGKLGEQVFRMPAPLGQQVRHPDGNLVQGDFDDVELVLVHHTLRVPRDLTETVLAGEVPGFVAGSDAIAYSRTIRYKVIGDDDNAEKLSRFTAEQVEEIQFAHSGGGRVTIDFLPPVRTGDMFGGLEGLEASVRAGGLVGGTGDSDWLRAETEDAVRLLGRKGPDLLEGGDGDDVLTGQGGSDTLFGGRGSDRLLGGDGHDVVFGDALRTEMAFELEPGAENLEGFGRATLAPQNGPDAPGADTMEGGARNDIFFADSGDDRMIGGGGQDIVVYTFAEDRVVVNLGAGRARVAGRDFSVDVVEGVEHAFGGYGTDLIQGDRKANILAGGLNADGIEGRGGADLLMAEALLPAGPGGFADPFLPGLTEALEGALPPGFTTTRLSTDSVGFIVGELPLVPPFAPGGFPDAQGVPEAIRDAFKGAAEMWLIEAPGLPVPGNAGDTLDGGGGRDVLIGSSHDDVLKAGKGDDALVGQGGADEFHFAAGEGRNTVFDFAPGEDTLVLKGILPADLSLAGEAGGQVLTVDGDRLAIWLPGTQGERIDIEYI